MLYQIIYNSLKGSMILFGIISLPYFCIYGLLFKKLPKPLKSFLNNRKLRKTVLLSGVAFMVTNLFLIGMLSCRSILSRGEDEEELTYIRNSIAVQKSIDMLFINEPEDDEMIKCLQKMHVKIEAEEKSISSAGLDYYTDLIEEIYVNGSQETKRQKGNDKGVGDKRRKAEKYNAQTSEDYLEEAGLWKQLFDDSSLPSDLYQYSRALKDAVEKGSEMEMLEMLDIASEAIDKGEEFLRYGDRNINGEEKKIFINAEDMAFTNGKIYYQLAERFANGTKEEREWVDSLWMLSYSCMLQADALINEDSVNYAKVKYYMGNICEHMLKRIFRADDLYFTIGREALSNYDSAQKALEQKENYYEVEGSMENNIRNGMETVKGLLEEK